MVWILKHKSVNFSQQPFEPNKDIPLAQLTTRNSGYCINKPVIRVGRSPLTVNSSDGCEIALTDDRSVSRSHASFSFNSQQMLVLRDAGSKFGTFLNEKRIISDQDYHVDEGDVIRFGVQSSEFEISSLSINSIFCISSDLMAKLDKLDALVNSGGTQIVTLTRVSNIKDALLTIVDKEPTIPGDVYELNLIKLVSIVKGIPTHTLQWLTRLLVQGVLTIDEEQSSSLIVPDCLCGLYFESELCAEYDILTRLGAKITANNLIQKSIITWEPKQGMSWISKTTLVEHLLTNSSIPPPINEPAMTIQHSQPPQPSGWLTKQKASKPYDSSLANPNLIQPTTSMLGYEYASLVRRDRPIVNESPNANAYANKKRFVKVLPLPRQQSVIPKILSLVPTVEETPSQQAQHKTDNNIINPMKNTLGATGVSRKIKKQDLWLSEEPQARLVVEKVTECVNIGNKNTNTPVGVVQKDGFKSSFFRNLSSR